MPPKRKRRVSKESSDVQKLRQTILTCNDSKWGWVGTEATRPSDITAEHLLASCGLSKRNNHPFCPNHYSSTSQDSLIDVDASQTQGHVDEDIIIVLDDEPGLPCTPKTCKTNPNCLNYLGQDQWEDEDYSMKACMKAVALGRNPSAETREPNLPTGLKNLGATCYANASLQVWFRDLAFRAGVYNCKPPFEGDSNFKESPIFQLQVTFSALQKSAQRSFNPTQLVESLQLRTTEQQDAQEFSKLFMSHLDAEFKKQADPQVKSLVTDQFQGQLIYGTICSYCQYRSERVSDFLEIEVNLEKKSMLEQRIAAVLQLETLSSDNQYFCSQCGRLRDATRYTELKELPPVLHFSLLRFVYDTSTMERKKSKHSITFPTTLDMSPFLSRAGCEPTSQQPQDNMYELCGVLLHLGPSAYHGHYEAQVYDDVNKSWFQFNDETVTRVNGLSEDLHNKSPLPNGNDFDELYSISQGQENSTNARKRRRIQSSDNDVCQSHIANCNSTKPKYISSRDAYMLIYSRRPAHKPNMVPPEPPMDALKIVTTLNNTHQELCQSFAEKEEIIRNEFRERRRKVMDIYSRWNVDSNDLADSLLVSRQALLAWLTQHKDENALNVTTRGEEGKPVGKYIFMNEIICPHGAIDPSKANNIKCISRGYQQGYLAIVKHTGWEFKPNLTVGDICVECVKRSFQERLYQLEHPRLITRFDQISEVVSHSTGFWISKAWIKDWKLIKPKMHMTSEGDPSPGSEPFSSDVLCEHNDLSPNVTCRAADLLRDLYPSWKPMSTELGPCTVCQATNRIQKKSTRDNRKVAENEKGRLAGLYGAAISGNTIFAEGRHYALIPTSFFKAWGRWINRPMIWSRPESIDNTPFFCEHEMLLLDANDLESSALLIGRSDWDALETLYPSGPLVAIEKQSKGGQVHYTQGVPVCIECRTKRMTEWGSTEITIHLARTRRRRTKAPNKDSPELEVFGARQSRRLQKMKEFREYRTLTVSKSTTVKEIKVMLQEEVRIPTICQRLFHHGRELLDNAITVEALGIIAYDALDLQQQNEITELDAEDDTDEQESQAEERGFGGTLLGGLDSCGIRKLCKTCTFSNESDVLRCTMCDTYFT